MYKILQGNTPEVKTIITIDIKSYISKHKKLFEKFKVFTSLQTNARGLAINQCSYKDNRVMHHVFCMRHDGKTTIYIDPKYVNIGGYKFSEEACLSHNGMLFRISRCTKIEATWYDMNGVLHQKIMEGDEAITYQHEKDHLLGKDKDWKIIK